MANKVQRNKLSPTLISLAVASCFAAGSVFANPTGPTVVNGQVTVNQAGNLLSITNSPNSIINWQAFSIGANEITRFTQQSAASAVLNRVVGAGGSIDPSVILGALQSNGRVFLLNPSGIVFGAGSQIDVAGLVASSLNLSNTDFLGGRLKFTEVPGAGAVVNQGAINAASGGQVYLVGPAVTNSGIITSPKGEVILAAGKSVELVNPGTPNLRVEITAPDNEAKNLGSIVADAGRVGIYAGLISSSGTIRADSAVATEDGRIVLKATKNVDLAAGSVLSANGPSGGKITVQSGDTTLAAGSISATGSAGKGGQVEVLGNLVGVLDSARIDVSGETGGGKALVGGDFQGKNPNVQNAFRTYFGPNATISADAVGKGDGGTVIVWSDDATGAYGSINARGGRESGNGGLVETSSRGWLDFHARVDTSAPNGRTGTLLLDPISVCVYNINPGACAGSGGVGSFTSGGAASIFTSSGTGTTLLAWGGCGGSPSIMSNLAFNNVVVTTSNGDPVNGLGNITIAESSPDLATGNLLQFVAHNNIFINGSVSNSGQGDLRFIAGWNETATPVSALLSNPFGTVAINPGVGDITVNASVGTNGNVLMRVGNNIDVNAPISAGNVVSGVDRMLTLDAGNRLQVFNNLTVTAGPGGTATMALSAGAGGITVMGAEGLTVNGGSGSFGSGQPGGSALLTMSSSGPISIQNTFLDVVGGEGGGNFSGPGGAGGNGTFTLNSGAAASIVNSTIRVRGGGGGSGASGSIETGINGSPGGPGGSAAFTASAPSISITGSLLEVSGGRGGRGGSGTDGGRGGDGGPGGSATLALNSTGNISITSSSIAVSGGSGGSGGFTSSGGIGGNGGPGGSAAMALNASGSISLTGASVQVNGGTGGSGGSAESGGIGGNGGPGGSATMSMNAGDAIAISASSSIQVNGGSGGSGGYGSSAGRGGDGGPGGNATATLNAGGAITLASSGIFVNGGDGASGDGASSVGGRGGDGAVGGSANLGFVAAAISITGSSINVRGGDGGNGGFGSSGANGGNGGNGGGAVMSLNANVAGSSITVDSSTLRVTGGGGGNGGFAGSTGSVAAGVPGSAGNGANAMGSLTASNITLTNSTFEVSGGFSGSSPFGAPGLGGNATAGLSAGGNVNVQNSFIGAEGFSGGAAAVIVRGDGSIAIGGLSVLTAAGGSGAANGGAAGLQLVSAAGPIVISGAEGIGAFGGSGSVRGGDAVTTIAAAGPVTIENTSLSNGFGIFATGGHGGNQGGNSTTTIDGQSITQTMSHVAATGGAGGNLSGSAVLFMTATGGDINVTGSGPQIDAPPEAGFFGSQDVLLDGTVIAQGGFGESVGSTAGGAQVRLAATGKVRITNEGVAAIGGAGEARGGDASLTLLGGTGVVITDSHVVAEGGFSDVQGGKADLFLITGNGNIEVRGTPGLATTVIARGGRVFFDDGIPGAAVLNFGVGGQNEIIIDHDSARVFAGGVGFFEETLEAAAAAFGPNADIFAVFKDRLSGGITVIGDPALHGFFRNGQPASPQTAYLGTPPPTPTPPNVIVPPPDETPPPAFDAQVVNSLITVAQEIAPKQEEGVVPNKDERDKKKKDREC